MCYDGKNFYATDHVEGDSGNQDNLLTGSGVTVGALRSDLAKARAKLGTYKDDQGHPVNHAIYLMPGMQSPLLVVCHPDLYDTFLTLRRAMTISDTSNVIYGTFGLMQDQYLTDTNDWYLDHSGHDILPFLMQDRQPARYRR